MSGVASALREVRDVPLRQNADLSRSAVDMDLVLKDARDGLFALVDSCSGAKCLVFDPTVAGPLKLVLVEGSGTLRNHGVVDVMELNWTDLEVEADTIIYVIRGSSKAAQQVASQISSSRNRYRFQVYFVPKRSFLCEQIFRNQGVFDILKNNIYEYQLGFIPYDTDVLSLGLDNAFAQVNLQSDDSTLMHSARALLKLQDVFGPIPNIQVKGDQSKKVLDMILRMRLEAEEELAAAALDRANLDGRLDDDIDDDDEEEEDGDGSDFVDSDGDEKNKRFLNEQNSENIKDGSNLAPLKSDLAFAMKCQSKSGSASASSGIGQIDTLLLIDRNIDLVTPMCTALTYEALLDTLVGIKNGHAMVDSDLVEAAGGGGGSTSSPGRRLSAKPKVSMSFNSSDHVYKEIRDMNIDVVLSFLNQKAREMKDNWQDVKAKEVEDLHSYVQTSLRSHVQESQLLPRHVNIVNRLRDTVYDLPFRKMWSVEREILEGENQVPYIEECIARQESWTKVLRLACLQSLVGNGIPAASLDSLRRSIVQTYGFELIFTLDNLEKLGMLKRRTTSSTWSSLVSTFRLIPPNHDPSKPDDVAYVTSGYAPLSARVVQLAIKPGWEHAKDTLKKLAGRTIFKVKQPGLPKPTTSSSTSSNSDPQSAGKRKIMLVFFTGGVTFAEIAALRFIAKQKDSAYDIVIASTTLMNGKTLLQSIAHEMENRLRQI